MRTIPSVRQPLSVAVHVVEGFRFGRQDRAHDAELVTSGVPHRNPEAIARFLAVLEWVQEVGDPGHPKIPHPMYVV